MATFTHDITFLSKSFDAVTGEWPLKEVTKTVTFKELDRNDAEQRNVQFDIVFATAKKAGSSYCDITTAFVESMIVIKKPGKNEPLNPDEFTEGDKVELLNDNGAIINFSFWLMKEKVTPFFPILNIK